MVVTFFAFLVSVGPIFAMCCGYCPTRGFSSSSVDSDFFFKHFFTLMLNIYVTWPCFSGAACWVGLHLCLDIWPRAKLLSESQWLGCTRPS